MTPEQLGLLLLGLVSLGGAYKLAHELLVKPHKEHNEKLNSQQLEVIERMNETNLKNLEYQKEIVSELSKINTSFGYESAKLADVDKRVDKNTDHINGLSTRVSVLEGRTD